MQRYFQILCFINAIGWGVRSCALLFGWNLPSMDGVNISVASAIAVLFLIVALTMHVEK
jgi:hypothetical protein